MIVIWLLYEEEDGEPRVMSPVYYLIMDQVLVLVERYTLQLKENYSEEIAITLQKLFILIKCEVTKDKNYIFLDVLLNALKE